MDWVLRDGDLAIFQPSFGVAAAIVRSARLAASGAATHGGSRLCVEGDEATVAVPGCSYLTPQYSIPGLGTLEIESLAADQKARKTRTGGKAVLLQGSAFAAVLKVSTPAQMPAPPGPPVPDPLPQYQGSGRFQTTNLKLKGT